MKNLIVSNIIYASAESPERQVVLSQLTSIFSLLLGEAVTLVPCLEGCNINLKRSVRLFLDEERTADISIDPQKSSQFQVGQGSPQNNFTGLPPKSFDISFERIKSPVFFRGIFNLAKYISENHDCGVVTLGPVKRVESEASTPINFAVRGSNFTYMVSIQGVRSLEALAGRLSFADGTTVLEDPKEVYLSLYGANLDTISGELAEVVAVGPGITLKGQIGPLGSFLIKEVVMSDNHIDSIQAEVKLGSISLKLRDLLELRPGSEIELDWPAESRGVLSIGGNKWSEVKIKLGQEKISLILPNDATFGA